MPGAEPHERADALAPLADAARPRRLSRAESKRRTRERLLDAAALVFARRGFSGASLEEIAETAGYTTGALYSNFPSKDALFLELMESRWSAGIERRALAVRELADASAGAGELVAHLSRLVAQLADTDRELAPLAAEYWLYAVRHPEAMALCRRLGEAQVRGLEPMLAAAMSETEAPEALSPTELTRVALLLFDGLVRERRIDREAVADDLFARVLGVLLGLAR